MAFDIITREAWGANRDTFPGKPLEHPVTFVYTMNINREPCFSVRSCSVELQRTQEYNMVLQNQSDIRYNFIVTGNGTIYEGRGWFTEPSLPTKHQHQNSQSLLIAFFGSGTYTVETLPHEMSKAARLLVEHGIANKYISKLFLYNDQMSYQALNLNSFRARRLDK